MALVSRHVAGGSQGEKRLRLIPGCIHKVVEDAVGVNQRNIVPCVCPILVHKVICLRVTTEPRKVKQSAILTWR